MNTSNYSQVIDPAKPKAKVPRYARSKYVPHVGKKQIEKGYKKYCKEHDIITSPVFAITNSTN